MKSNEARSKNKLKEMNFAVYFHKANLIYNLQGG